VTVSAHPAQIVRLQGTRLKPTSRNNHRGASGVLLLASKVVALPDQTASGSGMSLADDLGNSDDAGDRRSWSDRTNTPSPILHVVTHESCVPDSYVHRSMARGHAAASCWMENSSGSDFINQ
jgi:hypothetical protein